MDTEAAKREGELARTPEVVVQVAAAAQPVDTTAVARLVQRVESIEARLKEVQGVGVGNVAAGIAVEPQGHSRGRGHDVRAAAALAAVERTDDPGGSDDYPVKPK